VGKDTGQFIENGLGATKVMKLLRFVLDNVQGYLAPCNVLLER